MHSRPFGTARSVERISTGSVRLALLAAARPVLEPLGVSVPPYATLDYQTLLEAAAGDVSLSQLPGRLEHHVVQATQSIEADRIFVRLCPLDESSRTDLSFAGVFPTYMPRRDVPRRRQILEGVTRVLADRSNEYADYYYGRHRIGGSRPADVMFSGCIDDAAMCGTAYVWGERLLAAYFDTPLSFALHDPVRLAASQSTHLTGIEARLRRCAFVLQESLETPLDIEFIVTRREKLFVTEVRPISERHVRNWEAVSAGMWEALDGQRPPANVVNTVGTRVGTVVDLREREGQAADFAHAEEKIFVVRHHPTPGVTSSFRLLQAADRADLAGLAIVAQHGAGRHDNHLQYVMFEDPGVAFLVNVSELAAELPTRIAVQSDGFRVRFS